MTGQHEPVLYHVEKETGERLPSGYPRLKKLTQRHYMILNYHLQGMLNKDVAVVMDCTEATVSRVINDPLGRSYIEAEYSQLDAKFRALYLKAITAVDTGLDSKDEKTALDAARLYFQAHGKFRPADEKERRVTAEDTIAKLLQAAKERGVVSVTVTAGPRPDGFHQPPLIEGEAKEVA